MTAFVATIAILAVFAVIVTVIAVRQRPINDVVEEDREKLWWQAIK